jgi:hypothetical protein
MKKFSAEITEIFCIVLRIRIRQFLGLLDPDPLVRGTDPGSGSFYHQAKIVNKTLILTVL